MKFADEVITELGKPLARMHVKEREQSGRKLSYIEGWTAIAEANRIFGFDGWTRETVMSECCHAGTYEKAVWENGRRTNKTITSFRCSYRARVRVTVGDLVREGSGHGHGFADNPGEAHESAEKEAETDAMKRALMTFGNPFGLALYDKKQAEVEPVTRQTAQRPAGRREADPFEDDAERFAPPAGERSAAPPPSPPPNGKAAPATRAEGDELLARAIEIKDRLKAAIEGADEPNVIAGILKVNAVDLKFVKGYHEQTYERLMQLATARANELRAGA